MEKGGCNVLDTPSRNLLIDGAGERRGAKRTVSFLISGMTATCRSIGGCGA